MSETPYRSGYVTLLGKPNAGKSTLLNALVGQKVSIVSNKAQTTRRRIAGVVQGPNYQIVFIDTPGIHEPHTALGKVMREEAREALGGVDLVVVVVDASKRPDETDRRIAQMVVGYFPIFLCMNKMDKLRADKVVMSVEGYTQLYGVGDDYMLTTATQERNLDKLMEGIVAKMPEGEPLFDEDTYTDQTVRFIASELIREKVLIATREEVPHATAVQIREWEEEEDKITIYADIIVEKQGQKAIVIGNKGDFIKDVGTKARQEIEALVEKHVFLDLHVKVREDWRMNPRMVHELQNE